MQDSTTRRRFLRRTGGALAAGALGVFGPSPTRGVPQQVETEQASSTDDTVRLSCNLYSFNDQLMSGEMSLREVIDYCAELGFAAVDPTGYYFGTYPVVPSDGYTYAIKRYAFERGLDISGTGVRNDFTQPEEGARTADVEHVIDWLPFASKLGAPVLRVFAGSELEGETDRETATGWLVRALRICAEHGREHGVMIAVQNHAEFLHTAEEVIGVLEAVDSTWLGLHCDIGSFTAEDPYADIRRAASHAVTWQIKEHVQPGGEPEPTDLDRIVEIVREVGYRGYLPLETLGGDPREKLPQFLDQVRTALA